MKEKLTNYPGPSNLQSVTVGAEYRSIGMFAKFRAVMWGDKSVGLIIESGAAYMQLSASYDELHALREMLADVLADMPATEAA